MNKFRCNCIVKLVGVGKYTDPKHLNKQGIWSRDIASIYTIGCNMPIKCGHIFIKENGVILEKIQIIQDDTLEVVQEPEEK